MVRPARHCAICGSASVPPTVSDATSAPSTSSSANRWTASRSRTPLTPGDASSSSTPLSVTTPPPCTWSSSAGSRGARARRSACEPSAAPAAHTPATPHANAIHGRRRPAPTAAPRALDRSHASAAPGGTGVVSASSTPPQSARARRTGSRDMAARLQDAGRGRAGSCHVPVPGAWCGAACLVPGAWCDVRVPECRVRRAMSVLLPESATPTQVSYAAATTRTRPLQHQHGTTHQAHQHRTQAPGTRHRTGTPHSAPGTQRQVLFTVRAA